MYPRGKYMNSKFILCHNPSFATNVPLNSGLSAMTNNIKKRNANTKEAEDTSPVVLSFVLKESIAKSSGTNKSKINPITDPILCRMEAVVTTSFVSLTLKKQVNIHAPTANIIINKTDTVIRGFDTCT